MSRFEGPYTAKRPNGYSKNPYVAKQVTKDEAQTFSKTGYGHRHLVLTNEDLAHMLQGKPVVVMLGGLRNREYTLSVEINNDLPALLLKNDSYDGSGHVSYEDEYDCGGWAGCTDPSCIRCCTQSGLFDDRYQCRESSSMMAEDSFDRMMQRVDNAADRWELENHPFSNNLECGLF